MGLREQLKKAGLVSKKQAEKAESNQRKVDHNAKKNKQISEQINAEKAKELQEIEIEKQKRVEFDKELNKQRDLFMAQRESRHRGRQLILSNSQRVQDANEFYFFAEGRFVRKVLVDPWQREMLARGKLAIARTLDDIDEFSILPIVIARTVKEICPDKILVIHEELNDNIELDIHIS